MASPPAAGAGLDELAPLKPRPGVSGSAQNIARLNVGGTRYTVGLPTLQAAEGSYFDVLFSGRCGAGGTGVRRRAGIAPGVERRAAPRHRWRVPHRAHRTAARRTADPPTSNHPGGSSR